MMLYQKRIPGSKRSAKKMAPGARPQWDAAQFSSGSLSPMKRKPILLMKHFHNLDARIQSETLNKPFSAVSMPIAAINIRCKALDEIYLRLLHNL